MKLNKLVDVVYVLDLDRTLFATDIYVDILFDYIAMLSDGSEIAEKLRKDERVRRGQSYDLLAEVKQLVGSKFSEDEFVTYVLSSDTQLFYSGTVELLSRLERENILHIIVTYGTTKAQQLKLRLMQTMLSAHVKVPHAVIINAPDKARWLEQNCEVTPDSLVMPAWLTGLEDDIKTNRIVILDDKKANLITDSPFITGILVDNSVAQSQKSISAITKQDFHLLAL